MNIAMTRGHEFPIRPFLPTRPTRLSHPIGATRTASLAAFALAALLMPSRVNAQVTFKDAFPGLTFRRPVYFGELPGAAARTYVVLEQHAGEVTLIRQSKGAWVKENFLKIAVNQANEMGLLGIAFHPDFANNHKYYINYDPTGNLANIIEERESDATLLKDAGKARQLINIADKYDNHNGGTLAFGRDGFLYAGMGDGGSGNDPDGNGQNKNVLLGKMLRIDVNRKQGDLEYGIPADNPFASGGGRGEIYAYGLRNPWKWSFDRLNGDLWVADVGQDNVEEVDILAKGGNYGWGVMEGPNGRNNGTMILPVFSYDHNEGSCIIGGVVYRGDPASKYYGNFFAADLSKHQLYCIKKNGTGLATATKVGITPGDPVTFGTDTEGRIYMGTDAEASPIYMLDSPDLGPSLGIRKTPRGGWSEASFTVAPGGRLPAEAFGKADEVGLYALSGETVAVLARATPVLRAGILPGLYVLKAGGTGGTASKPGLLMVR